MLFEISPGSSPVISSSISNILTRRLKACNAWSMVVTSAGRGNIMVIGVVIVMIASSVVKVGFLNFCRKSARLSRSFNVAFYK